MIYREILARTTARYLRVRPEGIEITPGREPQTSITTEIFDHSPARTCYQNRRPVCRSLDGVRALGNPTLHCRNCELRPQCTPQIRLSLAFENTPAQLLLAFSSARNFLAYHAKIEKQSYNLADVQTRLVVVNHRTWGEVLFEIAGGEGRAETSQPN